MNVPSWNARNLSVSSSSAAVADKRMTMSCMVCYEELDDLESAPSRISLACHHSFCRGCLEDYCHYTVSIHRVPIPCPTLGSVQSCGQHIDDGVVQDVLLTVGNSSIQADLKSQKSKPSAKDTGKTAWIKYSRLKKLAADPSLLSCPRCDEVVAPCDDTSSSNDRSERRCSQCQHSFCAEHGDLHQGLKCQDYTQSKAAQELRDTEECLRSWTRPCSHCGAAIFKAAGCDHVVCPACHEDMCFRCGTHRHLTGKVIRRCSKCQQGFVDHRYHREYRIRLLLCLPFMLPGWIIYTVATGIFALLSGCFCCCFMCGVYARENKQDERKAGKIAPLLGAKRGFAMIFLPFVVFMRDVGIDCGLLELVGLVDPPTELPILTVETDEEMSASLTIRQTYGSMSSDDAV